jgi:hypothetical protein
MPKTARNSRIWGFLLRMRMRCAMRMRMKVKIRIGDENEGMR